MRQEELLTHCLQNNEDAINLAHMLGQTSHLFDDLIDRDKKVTRQDIYSTMRILLVELHYNLFFDRFKAELLPLISNSLTTWIAANDIEENKDTTLMHVSLITKSGFTPILIHMTSLIGGPEHARQCAPLIYNHVYDETLGEYFHEHGVEEDGLLQKTEED